MNQAVQKGPRGKDQGLAAAEGPRLLLDAGHLSIVHNNVIDKTLAQVEPLLPLHHGLHGEPVKLFVALKAGGLNRRTLGGVEQTEMDCRLIRNLSHLAPQGIDFLDQLTLGQASDGGIAGHQGDGIQADVEQGRFTTHPRRGQCGFTARMASPDDNDIVPIHFGNLMILLHACHERSFPFKPT